LYAARIVAHFCFCNLKLVGLFFNPRIANIKQVAGIYGSAVYEEMKKEWEPRSWGNIFSVLGGEENVVYVERQPAESEELAQPQYE